MLASSSKPLSQSCMTDRGALAVGHEIEAGPAIVPVIETDPLGMVAGGV